MTKKNITDFLEGYSQGYRDGYKAGSEKDDVTPMTSPKLPPLVPFNPRKSDPIPTTVCKCSKCGLVFDGAVSFYCTDPYCPTQARTACL